MLVSLQTTWLLSIATSYIMFKTKSEFQECVHFRCLISEDNVGTRCLEIWVLYKVMLCQPYFTSVLLYEALRVFKGVISERGCTAYILTTYSISCSGLSSHFFHFFTVCLTVKQNGQKTVQIPLWMRGVWISSSAAVFKVDS